MGTVGHRTLVSVQPAEDELVRPLNSLEEDREVVETRIRFSSWQKALGL